VNTVGEPDVGKPHVRFDEGRLARRSALDQPPTLLHCARHFAISVENSSPEGAAELELGSSSASNR
jgi:hypothetical protein